MFCIGGASKYLLRGPIASSRGAQIPDYLLDMSVVLRSGLLALEPLAMVFRAAVRQTNTQSVYTDISAAPTLLGFDRWAYIYALPYFPTSFLAA